MDQSIRAMKVIAFLCAIASCTAANVYFGPSDVPKCHVDSAGRTVVKYTDDHPAHESFLCQHAGNKCTCAAHPSHAHGKCRQFHHTDGSKHTLGGDCVTPKAFCYNGDCSYELIAKTMGGGYFKADAASNKYVSTKCSKWSTTSCVNPDFAAADIQVTDVVEDIHVNDGTTRQHHYAWGGQNLHQMRIVQATGKGAHHYKLKLFVGNFKPSGYTSPSHQGCGNSGTNYPGVIGTSGLHFEWQSYYNCGGHDGVYGAQGHWPQCAACGSNYRTYGQFSNTFYEGGRGKAATSYLYAKVVRRTTCGSWSGADQMMCARGTQLWTSRPDKWCTHPGGVCGVKTREECQALCGASKGHCAMFHAFCWWNKAKGRNHPNCQNGLESCTCHSGNRVNGCNGCTEKMSWATQCN